MLLWNEVVDGDANVFICIGHSSAIDLAWDKFLALLL